MGEFLIVAAQLSYAIGLLYLKKLLFDTNPFFVTALTTLIAALVLFPVLLYFSRELPQLTPQKIFWAVLAGIFWVALGSILLDLGLAKTTALRAGILIFTFPLFVTLLAIFFLGEAITLKFIAAAILMAAGYLVLVL